MKKYIYIVLILISASICAQEIDSINLEVGFNRSKFEVKCTIAQSNLETDTSKLNIYTCKNGPKEYYLKQDLDSKDWTLLELKDQKVKELIINKVKNKNEVLFRNFYSKDLVQKVDLTLVSKYERLDSIQYNFPELLEMKFTNSELDSLKNKINLSIKDEVLEIKNEFNTHQEVKIKTSKNQMITCTRPKQKNMDNQCIHYSCEDFTVNGKVHKVQLRGVDLNSADSTPYISSYTKEGLGEDILIKELITKNTKLFIDSNNSKSPSFTPMQYSNAQLSFERLNNKVDSINRKMELNNCSDQKLKLFDKSLDLNVKKMDKELSSIKVVQLIKNTNGYLESVSTLESNITSNMCRIGGDVYYYDKDNLDQSKIHKL